MEKSKNLTIDDLGGMIKDSFDEVGEKFNEMNKKIDKLQKELQKRS